MTQNVVNPVISETLLCLRRRQQEIPRQRLLTGMDMLFIEYEAAYLDNCLWYNTEHYMNAVPVDSELATALVSHQGYIKISSNNHLFSPFFLTTESCPPSCTKSDSML
jgi:hypothetical protein